MNDPISLWILLVQVEKSLTPSISLHHHHSTEQQPLIASDLSYSVHLKLDHHINEFILISAPLWPQEVKKQSVIISEDDLSAKLSNAFINN